MYARNCRDVILVLATCVSIACQACQRPSQGTDADQASMSTSSAGPVSGFEFHVSGEDLQAEEKKLGMIHQNMTTDWRIKLKPVDTEGMYTVEDAVPIGFDPATGKMTMGYPLGKDTEYEIRDRIMWFGRWVEPDSGETLLFRVGGLQNGAIVIRHVGGKGAFIDPGGIRTEITD